MRWTVRNVIVNENEIDDEVARGADDRHDERRKRLKTHDPRDDERSEHERGHPRCERIRSALREKPNCEHRPRKHSFDGDHDHRRAFRDGAHAKPRHRAEREKEKHDRTNRHRKSEARRSRERNREREWNAERAEDYPTERDDAFESTKLRDDRIRERLAKRSALRELRHAFPRYALCSRRRSLVFVSTVPRVTSS